MSGIFGIINLNAKPVSREKLEIMQAVMLNWGTNQSHCLTHKNAGFGQLLQFNTPESIYESLPFQKNNRLVTVAARLDNRDDLCQQFGVPHLNRPTTPDSHLIWLAYEKWGENCPDHLLGDWSFAIWNPQEQRLFLARDHYGNSSIYYYQDEQQFIFASSRKALLAVGVPRRLNELYLAQLLISWQAYDNERTIDLDIFRLSPAHAMTITPANVHIWRYWRLEDTPLLHLPSFDAYVEGFLDVFTEAVRSRLRSYHPIGSTLSGGLDSSSVTALAARELQKQGNSLTAFTSVPIYDTSQTVTDDRFGDETELAQLTANKYDNVNHQLITAVHKTPIAGIKQMLEIRDEPGHAGSNYFWILALFEAAQKQGIGTLLTGQGGNATISWTGASALSSFSRRVQQYGWKSGLKYLTPAPLLRAYQLRRLHQVDWQRSAIHPAFASRINLAKQHVEIESRRRNALHRWRNPIDARLSLINPKGPLAGCIWAEISAAFGIEVRDPTLDKRLMAYSLSIPDSYFINKEEGNRAIIRGAMKRLLPNSVRLNQKQGYQAADLGQRLLDSASEVDETLTRLVESNATHYLDSDKMRATFANLKDTISPRETALASSILMRGIDTGLFLESL